MERLLTRIETASDLDQALEAALGAWSTGTKEEKSYEERLFPLAAARMRQRAPATPFELGFFPVGTQPYSPLLAVLARPSRVVVLLHTPQTLLHARRVQLSLSDEGSHIELRDLGDAAGVERIGTVLRGEYLALGAPAPTRVNVDLTGGRKSTTAALGAIASLYRFRQSYIEGSQLADSRTFFVRERLVELESAAELFQIEQRSIACALLREHAFAAAAERFRRIAESSGRAAADEASASFAEALDAFWSGRFPAAARCAKAAAALSREVGAATEDGAGHDLGTSVAASERMGFVRPSDVALALQGVASALAKTRSTDSRSRRSVALLALAEERLRRNDLPGARGLLGLFGLRVAARRADLREAISKTSARSGLTPPQQLSAFGSAWIALAFRGEPGLGT